MIDVPLIISLVDYLNSSIRVFKKKKKTLEHRSSELECDDLSFSLLRPLQIFFVYSISFVGWELPKGFLWESYLCFLPLPQYLSKVSHLKCIVH